MAYELNVSIPMKGLPIPLFFLDTPPTTPNAENIPLSPLPPTPRTPRKSKIPRHSCDPSSIVNSTIIRFKMSVAGSLGTPSLQIMAESRHKSLRNVRKRLRWDTSEDNDWESETPITKSHKRRCGMETRSDTAPCTSELCRYNADADDEMENDEVSADLPSPPYSPVEYTDSSISKTSKKKQQPTAKTTSAGSCAKVKTCASCKTRKTPLWRDSEDGTPYCNACGIRYKKYRIRCPMCSYIPHKDENINNICCICGASLVHCKFRSR